MASKSRKTKRTPPQPAQASSDDALSRERIAAAAVELLDEQGLNGLTMRRLAEQLGSGVMSLYWHVKNKEEVLALALDSIFEYLPAALVAEPQGWRAEALHLLEDWRAIMLRHPWSASLLPGHALGQNILGRLELLGQALSSAGVADEELNAAIWSLWNYVMGAAITRSSFDHFAKERGAAPSHVPPSGQHPTIERSGLLLDDDWDGVFVRGLGFLLDGIISTRST